MIVNYKYNVLHLLENHMAFMGYENYSVRYGILPSSDIWNECGPYENSTDEYWDKKLKLEHDFYEKLEASILQDGFINPICIRAGYCPPKKISRMPKHMKNDHTQILMCDANGGSRLWIAKKYNMQVPCIICDYVDRFMDFKQVIDIDDLKSYYHPEPSLIRVNSRGMIIGNLEHIHLKD